MAEGKPFLPETETAVPIICQLSEGKVVGGRDGRDRSGRRDHECQGSSVRHCSLHFLSPRLGAVLSVPYFSVPRSIAAVVIAA